MKSNNIKFLTFFLSVLLGCFACSSPKTKTDTDTDINTPILIPAPQEMEVLGGVFEGEKLSFTLEGFGEESDFFQSYLLSHLPKGSIYTTQNALVEIVLVPGLVDHEEGYLLEVLDKKITLRASDRAGAFNGIQSLLTMIYAHQQPDGHGRVIIPCAIISDYPAFSWRGMHLDVSRHFFPVAFIKKYLDIMAAHKMNVFHWHLVDDQGWRIEIKQYPKLTSVGAYRLQEGDADKWDYFVKPAEEGKKNYGGFYTQEEVREIVAYAAQRNITVLPEIEMPGHSWAALNAYPELSCSGEIWSKDPALAFEFSDPYCAGNEQVYAMLEGVLSEVMDLFPSKYIHIGGDEAKKTTWEHCDKCQRKMKAEGIENHEHLQAYFVSRMDQFIRSKGRVLVGWDEILEGGLPKTATVMSWRGEKGGIEAAKKGHQVVMTPADYLYFNMYNTHSENVNKDFRRVLSLKDVYDYKVLPESLSKAEQEYILGAQACLWTEFVFSTKAAEQQLLPRLAALSEAVWNGSTVKDYQGFLRRLQLLMRRYDVEGWEYFVAPITFDKKHQLFVNQTSLTLNALYPDAEIYYTLDGWSDPRTSGQLYTAPVVLDKSTHVSTVVKLPNGASSQVSSTFYEQSTFLEPVSLPDNLTNGLYYQYDTLTISSLDELASLKLEVGNNLIDNFEIPKGVRADGFVVVYKGYILIPDDQLYHFKTKSDDGSRLFIGGNKIVDNDGVHAPREATGQVALKAGFYPIELQFFEGNYGEELSVLYEVSEGVWEKIPDNWLYRM